jgi:hypothetical protein
MSYSKKILGILFLAMILHSISVLCMETGDQKRSSCQKIGLFWYRKLSDGRLIKMSLQELRTAGISINPVQYGTHIAAEHPYATGNALIAAGGSVVTAIGKQNNWFTWKKGALGTLGSMAVYSGLVGLYQWLKKPVVSAGLSGAQKVDVELAEPSPSFSDRSDATTTTTEPLPIELFYSWIMMDAHTMAQSAEARWQEAVVQQIKDHKREDLQELVTAFYASTCSNLQENYDALAKALGKETMKLTIDIPVSTPKVPAKSLPTPSVAPIKKEGMTISFGKKASMVKGFLEEDAKRIAKGETTISKTEVGNAIKLLLSLDEVPADLQAKVDAFYRSGRENVQKNLDALTQAFSMERIEIPVSQSTRRKTLNSMGGMPTGDLANNPLFAKRAAAVVQTN